MQQPWTGPADKYEILQECRAALLEGLVLAVRDGGVSDREAIAALQEAAGAYFDEMVSSVHKPGFEAADGLTASRISLVPESELELEIELGNLARRLSERLLDHLRRVYLRLVTLLNRPDLPTEGNPAGIDCIKEGLTRMFSVLNQPIERALARLESIESCLERNLPGLYDQLVAILDRHQVKPAVARVSAHSGAPGGGASGGSSTGERPAAAPAATPAVPESGSAAEPQPVPLQGITQEMLNRLFARLDLLEANGVPSGAPLQTGQPAGQPGFAGINPALLANLAQLAQPGGAGASGEGLGKAVDHLARIFTAIFEHPMLPDAVKSAIGSLQSTIIKAAMLDGSFYTAEQHPIRRLLQCMIEVSIGLPPDTGHDHPCCAAVREAATRLRKEFSGDIRIFRHALAEVEVLAAVREEQIKETAQRFTALLDNWDKLEQAHAVVGACVEELLNDAVPTELASFLRYDWARVLQKDFVEHGAQSAEYLANRKLAKELLQSIQPVQGAEERKQRVAAIPALLAALNAGFERIQLSKAERDAFMDSCFKLQTNALRGIAPPAPPAPVKPPVAAAPKADAPLPFTTAAAPPALRNIALDGGTLRVWQSAAAESTPAFTLTGRDWISLRWPETNELLCGCLLWQNPESGNCLIANPDWDFAIVIAAGELERLLATRQARLASAFAVF